MKNIKLDCHIHTHISPDSKAPLEEICESAIEKNINSIIITNHFEYYTGKKDGKLSTDMSCIDDGLREIDQFRANFKGKLEILFGMEIGQIQYWPKHVKNITESYPFDYLIGSIHKIENIDLKYGDYSYENREKQNIRYLDLLYDLAKNGDYDCIGHFDLVKRYAPYKLDLMEKYEEKIKDILKIIIKRGKGIEINTSGLRQSCEETMPSPSIVELYKNLGGNIITIGSDAHISKDVGEGFDEAVDLLKRIGFRKIAIYRKRKIYFYDI
jgi:histidinol-phosphatase (PHP family)